MSKFIVIRERGNGCDIPLVYEELETWNECKQIANKYRTDFSDKENNQFIVLDTTYMVCYKLMDL